MLNFFLHVAPLTVFSNKHLNPKKQKNIYKKDVSVQQKMKMARLSAGWRLTREIREKLESPLVAAVLLLCVFRQC